MSVFAELKRRNVFRVAAAYAVVAWLLIEGDIGLVFGTTEIRFASSDGSERVSTQRYTATYVKREDGWRLLALQMQQRAPRE